jgi:predicted MFS family arabinose efflux permease
MPLSLLRNVTVAWNLRVELLFICVIRTVGAAFGWEPQLKSDESGGPTSTSGAFSNASFAVMWAATTLSLTGLAISDTSSAWLMTTLNPDPRAVSLVQVASSLPMFLCTLPAGALADIVEPRRFLIVLESLVVALMTTLGAVIYFGGLTPGLLLSINFVLSAVWSLASPAWLTTTPLLVAPRDLAGANAANGVGYNLSRAIGPAIAGVTIAKLGTSAPYWLFAAADLSSIVALIWWRPSQRSGSSLTRQRVACAVRIGVRHALKNRRLRATMVRTAAVYPFACAYLALLPLIARHQLTYGPALYGVLLAIISAGAVLGSVMLSWMQRRLDADRVVAVGTCALAVALVIFGLASGFYLACAAALLAGAAWTIVLSALYVAAQLALPDWVRGRGLSIFLTVIFGSITIGSAVWGWIAAKAGLETALLTAAAGAVFAIPLSWPWKLGSEKINVPVPPVGAQPVA